MPIDLGLLRVLVLLKHLNNPQIAFRAIHVAGTNGKGLTLAYLLLILTAANVRNGRFTLPHMLYYNDCIHINGEVYPLQKYRQISELVVEKDRLHNIGCTEFELLTVTAFKIFEVERVDVALIEVGLGGRLDATNVLPGFDESNGKETGGVIASGITKIARDHELLLGDTLTAIAGEKAGILKLGVPCVVDLTNEEEVLDVVRSKAHELGCALGEVLTTDLISYSPLAGSYQQQNLAVALGLLKAARINVPHQTIIDGIKNTHWAGRLQLITVNGLPILLDGAHNENAAIELGKYLQKFRPSGIIFVVAMTSGKSIAKLLKHVTIKDKDTVVATTFTTPENMPWISCYPTEELARRAGKYVNDVVESSGVPIMETLDAIRQRKQEENDTRPVVVCGSLYLCGDVLRAVTPQ